MVHSQIKGGYHEVSVCYEWEGDFEKEADTDMFIGRFDRDGLYHLLGHRPKVCAYMFSAESESNLDLGIVELPEGKKNLADLVNGEILTIIPGSLPGEEPVRPYRVKYFKHN